MGIIVNIFLPLSLAFIMFALGLSLKTDDFTRVLKQPRDFLVGFFSQIFILPLVALLLVLIWPLSPELAIGVMILAAAPGGATSNILTAFSKGDVALSISLTAIISLICALTIPFIIFSSSSILLTDAFIIEKEISLVSIATQMFLIVTIPVILGMLFKTFISNFASKFEPIARKISIFLFVLVLLGAILSERENIISYFSQAGLVTLTLNILMMIIAFNIGKMFASGEMQKRAITIECGLQNGTLAIVVATSIFGGGIYLIPAATYSLIMFLTSLIFIYFVRRN